MSLKYGFAAPTSDPYGAIIPPEQPLKTPFTRNFRKRMNGYAIGLAVLIPLIIYAAVFSALTLSLHYYNPVCAWLIAIAALLVVLVFFGLSVDAYHRRSVGDNSREPTWYVFLFITSLIWWIVAVGLGCGLYNSYFLSYYDLTSLGTYSSVDPSRAHGQSLMDASRVNFRDGSYIKLDNSMSFRNDENYCVAPITFGSDPLAAYDFWAVGENCCSPTTGSFRCGPFNDPSVHGGLRVFDDKKQSYYRLAVQQAESAFKIQAIHPLFFTWIRDPTKNTNDLRAQGIRSFVIGLSAPFVIQILLVLIASLVFAKTIGQMQLSL